MTKPASVSGAGLWWVDASGNTLSFPAEPVKPMGAGLLSARVAADSSASKAGAGHELSGAVGHCEAKATVFKPRPALA